MKTKAQKPAPYIPANKEQLIEQLRDMDDSHERDAVLSNVEGDAYTREQDLATDLAHLAKLQAQSE